MGIKLFPQKTEYVLNRDDMRAADPLRTPTDFSSADHQAQAHQRAGYTLVGESPPINPGKSTKGIQMKSDPARGVAQRWQNGRLWEKPISPRFDPERSYGKENQHYGTDFGNRPDGAT